MTDIATELKELSDSASFTMVDMATWCECDKSAVREWMTHGVTPHPVKMKHLRKRLDLLKVMLKDKSKMLPVPIQIKQYDRVKHVQQARDYALRKLSKASITN